MSLSPDPGPILPFGWQSSPRLLPPSLPGLPSPPHHPSAPRALPCPALPPQPPGRTQPGSRARAVSVRPLPAGPGMQLDRGGGRRHSAPSGPSIALRQAGGPGLPGPGLLRESEQASCLSLEVLPSLHQAWWLYFGRPEISCPLLRYFVPDVRLFHCNCGCVTGF